MSIGPVQNLGPVTEAPSAKVSPPVERSQTTASQHDPAEEIAQPETGTLPKQKELGVKNLSSPAQLPQDEVQVQRDSQIKDEVIIKYLNTATGDLILQVPSAEVLSVDRGIYQEFQQQAKVRENAGTAPVADRPSTEGEEPHGN
ncbi:MAG: hypothetical protein WAO10_11495 [Candidatus Sulfotelmatobacter sp.]